MKSTTRQQCEDSVRDFADYINAHKPLDNRLLYVGIAGDPIGGEYSPMFPDFQIKTFDLDPKWGPDIVGDITNSDFNDNSWDVIVCVQVAEHIETIWELPKEIHRILSPGGYLIVDCPWDYPYHAEPPSFKDCWRITKDGFESLFKDQFRIIEIQSRSNNTSCLIQKL